MFEQRADVFVFLFLDVRFVSSGNWHKDRLTVAEKLAYQRAMGFNNWTNQLSTEASGVTTSFREQGRTGDPCRVSM